MRLGRYQEDPLLCLLMAQELDRVLHGRVFPVCHRGYNRIYVLREEALNRNQAMIAQMPRAGYDWQPVHEFTASRTPTCCEEVA